MNRFDLPLSNQEARIQYDHADYHIVSSGSFVNCAVTGKPIPVEELKYWSVERQEAYYDVQASCKRYMETLKVKS